VGFGVAEVASWTRLTASGNVGDAAKAVDIIGYAIKSSGTAALPWFINGSSGGASNTLAWRDQGRVATGEQTITTAYPIRLAGGCYVSFDANTTAVAVFYRQMLST
jgi:hypothetical protein